MLQLVLLLDQQELPVLKIPDPPLPRIGLLRLNEPKNLFLLSAIPVPETGTLFLVKPEPIPQPQPIPDLVKPQEEPLVIQPIPDAEAIRLRVFEREQAEKEAAIKLKFPTWDVKEPGWSSLETMWKLYFKTDPLRTEPIMTDPIAIEPIEPQPEPWIPREEIKQRIPAAVATATTEPAREYEPWRWSWQWQWPNAVPLPPLPTVNLASWWRPTPPRRETREEEKQRHTIPGLTILHEEPAKPYSDDMKMAQGEAIKPFSEDKPWISVPVVQAVTLNGSVYGASVAPPLPLSPGEKADLDAVLLSS